MLVISLVILLTIGEIVLIKLVATGSEEVGLFILLDPMTVI